MERTLADTKQAIESNLSYLCSSHFQNVNRFIRKLQKEELLSPDDITTLLTHTSDSKRLHCVFKTIKEKDGFFDKLMRCFAQSDNHAIVEKLNDSVLDFYLNENQLPKVRDVIIEDITVIRNWIHIKDEFLSHGLDSLKIETMIDDRKHPAEFVLETLRMWRSRCSRPTINCCIEKFRETNCVHIADKLNTSKRRILGSESDFDQVSETQPQSNLKSKCTTTTVAIWQQSILIEQMLERFRENNAEIHFLKSRIELLEAQVTETTMNQSELIELKKRVVEREKEMTAIQEIVASLQSEYNDKKRIYTQDGGRVWQTFGLNKFTGIPKSKALALRTLELNNLTIKVSTLFKALDDCKSLKKLTLLDIQLRGDGDENAGFWHYMLYLLDNCSPHLELEIYGIGMDKEYWRFRVSNLQNSVQPIMRAFLIYQGNNLLINELNWFFEHDSLAEDPSCPVQYMPRECQAFVLKNCNRFPKKILNNFCAYCNVAQLVLIYITKKNYVMKILRQIRGTKCNTEYILIWNGLEIASRPQISDFPEGWNQVLEEAGFDTKLWRWIVFEKQLDSSWKARCILDGNEKEIDRRLLEFAKVNQHQFYIDNKQINNEIN